MSLISISPAAELSNATYTHAADGVVGFVVDPVRDMLPHVRLLVVNVELASVSEGDKSEFACI